MSLVGFQHVFARSVLISFAPDVQFNVAPPPVIALLKIVAYSEDPNRRRKDLEDLKSLLRHYEENSDRTFGDNVFAAELRDYEHTNAFLLGSDVGVIATDEDLDVLNRFLSMHTMSSAELDPHDLHQRDALRFHMELEAFEIGINTRQK